MRFLQSRTGTLEGAEVDGFLKDMIETIKVCLNSAFVQLTNEWCLK